MRLLSKIRKALPEPSEVLLKIERAPSEVRELIEIGRKLLVILEDIVKREELTRDLDEAYQLARQFIEGVRYLREKHSGENVPEYILKTLQDIENEAREVASVIERMINILHTAREELRDVKAMLQELRDVLKRMSKAIKLAEKLEGELMKVGVFRRRELVPAA